MDKYTSFVLVSSVFPPPVSFRIHFLSSSLVPHSPVFVSPSWYFRLRSFSSLSLNNSSSLIGLNSSSWCFLSYSPLVSFSSPLPLASGGDPLPIASTAPRHPFFSSALLVSSSAPPPFSTFAIQLPSVSVLLPLFYLIISYSVATPTPMLRACYSG